MLFLNDYSYMDKMSLISRTQISLVLLNWVAWAKSSSLLFFFLEVKLKNFFQIQWKMTLTQRDNTLWKHIPYFFLLRICFLCQLILKIFGLAFYSTCNSFLAILLFFKAIMWCVLNVGEYSVVKHEVCKCYFFHMPG